MIRILDRYLLRSFLTNYLMALFVLISLYVVLDLSFNSDEFTEAITEGADQGGSYMRSLSQVAVNIADYYFFNIPLYFSQLSGVITLFAGCVTLARLQRQNEVTAILSSGTSLYRLAMPIILAGLVMNGLLVFDQEILLPSIAPKLARPRDNVEGARTWDLWCLKDRDGRLFSARKFSPKEQEIAGLTVIERFNDPGDPVNYDQLRSVIRADRAKWDEQKGGWDLTQRGILLEVGRQTAVGTAKGASEKLDPVAISFYETDLSPSNLQLRKSAQWLDFLSLGEVTVLEKRGDAEPARVARIRHTRFTLPISNMVLLMLGIPFFMNRLPGNVLGQGAKALAICAVAFLITFLGQQIVEPSGGFWQPLPYWLPIFIFGPISVLLMDNVKT
jgi:lipopolysaccharide export system permease protein